MKVCLCKGSFYGSVSGADRTLINYAQALRAAGHQPHVLVACRFAPDDPNYLRLRQAGIPMSCLAQHPVYLMLLVIRRLCLCLPALALLSWLRDWEALAHCAAVFFFRWHRPSVAHVIVEGGIFIKAAHAAGVPVLYQECSLPWSFPRPDIQTFYERLSQSLSQSSAVAALSPLLVPICQERLPCPGPVLVLPIIIHGPDNLLPRNRAVPGRVLTFGFAARLERLKGAFVLLEALAQFVRGGHAARLRLAGTGDEEEAIKAFAGELGIADCCDFMGAYKDAQQLAEFMDSIDVLLHPSYAEGTPNSIGEALAHGVPVVASAVGGVPDILTEDVGILIPPDNVNALVEAMEALARDPHLRGRMGAAGKERHRHLFSEDAVAPVLFDVYSQTIARVRGQDYAGTRELSPSPRHPWAPLPLAR